MRAICIALACLFFMLAAWKFQQVIQNPSDEMLWTKLGLAMFVASMGHTLISMCKTKIQ